jgi:glycosyltransferase involved in cell wall biosynthesis
VDPEDVEALAARLVGLVGDTERRGDLARRGVARAALFTWERTAAIVHDLYREVGR